MSDRHIAAIVLDGGADDRRRRAHARARLRCGRGVLVGGIAAVVVPTVHASATAWLTAGALALGLHVVGGASISGARAQRESRPPAKVLTLEREVELAPPPRPSQPEPTPVEPALAEPVAAPEPAPSASPSRTTPTRAAPRARAAQVAAASPMATPPEFDGFDMTVGDAPRFAGGVTAGTGTSAQRGGDATAASVGRAAARDSSSSTRSRARPVRLSASNWSCEWPTAARELSRTKQVVMLRVLVRADGSVSTTEVLADPGHGFGAAAEACARTTAFQAALDDDGKPHSATSPPIRVTFERTRNSQDPP